MACRSHIFVTYYNISTYKKIGCVKNMKIPETAQKQTEDIAIGSGYMYIKEYEKGSAIPKISEIAVEENRKGYLSWRCVYLLYTDH